jgi:Ethanolamine utilization protein EutJ (predicted chaperonin)
MIKPGDDVEILISSSDFDLSVGQVGTVVDIVVDKNDKPVLAVIRIETQGIDEWNQAFKDGVLLTYLDNGFRNISLDHIRLPK